MALNYFNHLRCLRILTYLSWGYTESECATLESISRRGVCYVLAERRKQYYQRTTAQLLSLEIQAGNVPHTPTTLRGKCIHYYKLNKINHLPI